MVSTQARVSLEHFVGSFMVFTIMGQLNIYYKLTTIDLNIFIFFTTGLMIWVLIRLAFDGEVYEIALRAAFLGSTFGLGLYMYLTCQNHIGIFGIYMCVVSFFHISEFVAIAFIQPNQVSVNSFVLNHSLQYTIAAVASWIEFFIEVYFYPDLKKYMTISCVGLAICICGETLRKLAMYTAGKNFNHLVQCEKAKDHILVTKGIYAWFRHPSYVGWFYWAIGTQIILLNPICIPAYAIVSWHFFKTRIYIEEITLLNFFGQNYVNYQHKVGTGIPFINGYRI
ncbi:protein-S-isoprenylcysteine O-methyltransferase [Cylas formicarius]|uniref:protein-S-isoprenylcysteine O-methyltransferase n=1 Tax=Cylas formicarius TaxID=197179 RepID=UPI0029586177|nr:protein-S-isoprenylcysteine O-methyltransferase [Cylas formicarius]